jgi:hypothetical protein
LKVPFLKILTLLFFLFLANGLNAQTRFGNVACDSFQVTVDETEAIIYQKNKTAVYNRAKQEFLIKPTESSVIFFPVDNYYLEVDKKDMMLYNFHCTDTIAPCIEEYQADSSLFFNTTSQGKITMTKDGFHYGVFPNFHLKTEWSLFRSNERYPNSAIRSDVKVNPFKSVGVERLNDSLLLIMNYKSDYRDLTDTPIKSLIYPDEDSVIFDPETGFYLALYPGPDPGYEFSGVFNLNAEKWLVPPTNLVDFCSENGFIVANVARVLEFGWVDSMCYSFMDIYGHILFKEKGYVDLKYSPVIAAIVTTTDSAIAIPEYRREHRDYSQYFQIVKDGKMSLINTARSFEPICKFKDFVHYNLPNDYFFWLENDSIYTDLNGREYAVSQKNGKIEVYPSYTFPSQCYQVHLIEGKDTTINTVGDGVYLKPFNGRATVRIEIIDGNLIINDYDRQPNASEVTWQEYRAGETLRSREMVYREDSHPASSVWRKEENGWVKKTPYCKTVEKLNFGYLLMYCTYFKENSYSQKSYTLESFTIVDNNFKPMELHGVSEFSEIKIVDNWMEFRTQDTSFYMVYQGDSLINGN